MSEEPTELQRRILSLILENSHRASAITRTLRGKNVECNQNDVITALNDLEKRGLVERVGSKSWTARPKAQGIVE
ncbi:MAG: hypothetical protein ACXADO_09355 [Candidatus Thorarchaeota archaeon]